jgi:hypothetical protein
MTKVLPIRINVADTLQRSLTVRITVLSEIPIYDREIIRIPATIVLNAIPVNVFDAIYTEYKNKASNRIDSFFDNDRQLKTIINFGNDYQALLTNWMYDPADATGQTILVKLYLPLPDEVTTKTKMWISRELSPPLNDKLFVSILPPPEQILYLRPPNRNVVVAGRTGASVDDKSLVNLLSSSSFDIIKPDDPVVKEWYTHDFNLSELNINYADYREFVFFGSAKSRLNTFTEKLRQIEELNTIIASNSSSLAATGSAHITGSTSYPAIKKLGDDRLELIRSFDGYERFLYYDSGEPYSSSLNTDDAQDAIYYHSDATWPKISGSAAPVASASAWLTAQLAIASAYDTANQNALKNNIPEYLVSDDLSVEFAQFLDLVGHQFDTLKVYIDQMPNIFDRDSDPSVGLSPDMVWNIAKSFGIELPNQYAIKNLVDYTIGDVGQVSPTIYRQAAAETWKRFLHNQIFLMKTKGTKQSLTALANVYGVLPTTLRIRESATPGIAFPTGTFETYEEQTNALTFSGAQYVSIPGVATQNLRSLEIRFSTTTPTQSVLIQGDILWSICLAPVSGTSGFILLKKDSSTVATIGPLNVYSGDFYNVALTRASTSSILEMSVRRADLDIIAEEYHTTESAATPHISITNNTYLGGSGSFFGQRFTGLVDEVRMWTEALEDNVLGFHARYPGLYNGNTSTSSRDLLLVRLSFNKPQNLGSSSLVDRFVPNESPYIRNVSASAILTEFSASNFANAASFPYSTTTINRTVQRFNPNGGANLYSTNKVTIAEPANLRYVDGNLSSSIPILRHDKSIVSLQDKQDFGKSTNLVGFYFSLTDAINDSIVKSIGYFDIQDLIGDPRDSFESQYADLHALNELYWNFYAYSYNVNSFVDFVKNLLDALFIQARELVPARAKLLTGIVHEPHILERAKIEQKPLEVSAGQFTRHNTDTYNLEATVIEASPTWSADISNPSGLIIITGSTDIAGFTLPLDGIFNQSETMAISGSMPTYLAPIHVTSSTAIISGSMPTYNSAISRLVWEVFTPSKTSVNNAEPSMSFVEESVKQIDDFFDLEAYTYFSDVNGLVPTLQQVFQRSNSGVLRSRGVWTTGTVYTRNDYVLQSGSIGDAIPGNDSEFICISTDGTFSSNIPPYLDPANWTPMIYSSAHQVVMKLAVLINNAVALVSPVNSSNYPIVREYRPSHFKFYRDYHRGTVNHQWLGCLQTISTTTDGLPPITVTFTQGDTLVVHDPTEPIQPVDNVSGPILDVQ